MQDVIHSGQCRMHAIGHVPVRVRNEAEFHGASLRRILSQIQFPSLTAAGGGSGIEAALKA